MKDMMRRSLGLLPAIVVWLSWTLQGCATPQQIGTRRETESQDSSSIEIRILPAGSGHRFDMMVRFADGRIYPAIGSSIGISQRTLSEWMRRKTQGRRPDDTLGIDVVAETLDHEKHLTLAEIASDVAIIRNAAAEAKVEQRLIIRIYSVALQRHLYPLASSED